MNKPYNVVFEINIHGDSPIDVAKKTQALLEEAVYDWQFFVQDTETKEIFSVDLSNENVNTVKFKSIIK